MSDKPGRLPPQNIEAEERVLSAILNDPACLGEVRRILTPEDFYRHSHRCIFAAIRSQADEDEGTVDILTVVDELKRTGKLDAAGGSEAVAGLADNYSPHSRAPKWARLVAECAAKRRIIQSLTAGLERAWEDDVEADVLAADLRGLLDENIELVRRDAQDTEDVHDIIANLGEDPAPIVDELIVPGTCGFIGADPGGGKSTAADALAVSLALGQMVWSHFAVPFRRRMLLIQLEDPKRRHGKRLQRLALGLGHPTIPPGWLFRWASRRFFLDDPRDVHAMLTFVRKMDIGGVIADPFVYMHGKEEKDNMEMMRILKPIKDAFEVLNSFFCIIHHHGHVDPKYKESMEFGRLRGASSMGGWRDFLLTLTPRGPLVSAKFYSKDLDPSTQKFSLVRKVVELDDGQKAERINWLLPDAIETKADKTRDEILEAIRFLAPSYIDGRVPKEALVAKSGKGKGMVVTRVKELADMGLVQYNKGTSRSNPFWAKLLSGPPPEEPQGDLDYGAGEDAF